MSVSCRLGGVYWKFFRFVAIRLPLVLACVISAHTHALPLFFEPNHGQAPKAVRFLAQHADYAILLADREIVLKSLEDAPVTLRLAGVKKPRVIQGEQPTGGVSNYFLGPDPSKWHSDIPHFASVRYGQIYPGIDLVFHGHPNGVEYDFVISPGADSGRIQFEIEGTSGIAVDGDGNLLLHTHSGVLRQEKPFVYQEMHGERVRIDSQFVLSGSHSVGIRVSDYDRSKLLIIDPVISLSATLSSGATSIALDSAGNVLIVGGAPVVTPLGTITVNKLNAMLSTVLYSTTFGPANSSSASASASAMVLDASGNIYITGSTSSTSFPTTPGAFQTTFGNPASPGLFAQDAFLPSLIRQVKLPTRRILGATPMIRRPAWLLTPLARHMLLAFLNRLISRRRPVPSE